MQEKLEKVHFFISVKVWVFWEGQKNWQRFYKMWTSLIIQTLLSKELNWAIMVDFFPEEFYEVKIVIWVKNCFFHCINIWHQRGENCSNMVKLFLWSNLSTTSKGIWLRCTSAGGRAANCVIAAILHFSSSYYFKEKMGSTKSWNM